MQKIFSSIDKKFCDATTLDNKDSHQPNDSTKMEQWSKPMMH
jgi:hypothetical protein